MIAAECASLDTLAALNQADTAPTQAAKAPSARPGAPRGYREIALSGRIGVDVTAVEVEEALAEALRNPGCVAVLVRIDAVDGDDGEGVRIAKSIARAALKIPVLGLVERCEGPAVPSLFACQTLYAKRTDPARLLIACAPAGDSGSASSAINSNDPTATAASNDLAAGVSLTQLRGQLENLVGNDQFKRAFVRSLTDPRVKLTAWRDGTGKMRASNEPPAAGMPSLITLQGEHGGIQMTEGEAFACGLVIPIDSLTQVGEVADIPHWRALPTRARVLIDDTSTGNALAAKQAATTQVDRTILDLEGALALAGRLGTLIRAAENSTDIALSQPPLRLVYEAGAWLPTERSLQGRRDCWSNASSQWNLVRVACLEIDAVRQRASASLSSLPPNGPLSARRGIEAALLQLEASAPARGTILSSALAGQTACAARLLAISGQKAAPSR